MEVLRPVVSPPLLTCLLLLACVPEFPGPRGGGSPDGDMVDAPSPDDAGPLPPLPEPDAGSSTTTSSTTSDTGSTTMGADGDGGSADGDTGPKLDGGGGGTNVDPATAQLRLVEVLVDPAGKDGAPGAPEYIELQNPGPLPVALDGVLLLGTSWPDLVLTDLPLDSTSLLPEQSLVIYRFSGADSAPDTPAMDVAFSSSGGLRNADGWVVLTTVDADPSAAIDTLVYGATSTEPATAGWSGAPAPDPGADEALCAPLDGASSWSVCAPSPGVASPVPVGPLVITEVCAGSPLDDDQEKRSEFIEITNNTSSAVDMAGWTLVTTAQRDPLEWIAGSVGCSPAPCLAAGARALIVNDDFALASGDAALLVPADGRLSSVGLDGSDPIALERPDGQLASTHRYWSDPQGSPRSDGLDASLHRTSASASDAPASWAVAKPTPEQAG